MAMRGSGSSPWRAPSAKANDKATQVVCKSMLFCFAMQSHFELRVRLTDHAANDDNGWRLELGRSNIGSQCADSREQEALFSQRSILDSCRCRVTVSTAREQSLCNMFKAAYPHINDQSARQFYH